MKGLLEYGETRASTVHPDTVSFQLAYSTSKGFIHRTFDCTNAFQCTFEDNPQKCMYCYLPPFYQYRYNSRYPHDKNDPSNGPFILQAAQLIQGSPRAANRGQENLHAQLTNIGYIRNNIDHSFYTKYDDSNKIEALLSIMVDDFLLSYRTEATQQHFYKNLSSAFDITTPSDITKLKFLSLTIYQSKFGTSIDQTSHIQSKNLAPWFDNGHLPKYVNSPFPTDTHYEEDLAQSTPLQDDELKLYEKRYHGALNQSIGKLLHIQQWTCLDINYAVTRLASFTRNPNKPAFLALEHLMRYLHSHLHEPIFYPNTFQAKIQKITYQFSSKQSATYDLSSYTVFFSDSSFANILPNQRLMQSNCGLFNCVVTSWGTNIQTSIASDSTDAEIRSIYTTTKKIVAFTHFLTIVAPFTISINNPLLFTRIIPHPSI